MKEVCDIIKESSKEESSHFREPPAPSNKKFSKNRTFMFPTSSPFQSSPVKDVDNSKIKEAVCELTKSFDR